MRAHRLATSVAIGLAVALAPSVAASDEALPGTALLSGSFGKVVGGGLADPATADPDGRPLSTWMRSEMLELVLEPPLDEGTRVSITATADGGERVELAFDDGRWVTAPDEAGLHVVVATVTRGEHETADHAWLLDVGDRSGSWETMLERPPLHASLVSAAGAVVGARGHGCLTGFCQEVGYRPPAHSLEPLAVVVGEPLTLELDDGSAMVHWEGRAEPLSARSETRLAQAAFDQPVAGPVLTGLEPDAAGEWLLEVRADYDRERGWQWYLFRLIAE